MTSTRHTSPSRARAAAAAKPRARARTEVGLSEGDVVVAINPQPVKTPQEAAAKLNEAATAPKKSALLLLNRRGVTQYVGVNLSTNQG